MVEYEETFFFCDVDVTSLFKSLSKRIITGKTEISGFPESSCWRKFEIITDIEIKTYLYSTYLFLSVSPITDYERQYILSLYNGGWIVLSTPYIDEHGNFKPQRCCQVKFKNLMATAEHIEWFLCDMFRNEVLFDDNIVKCILIPFLLD
jgi:hypothetical protein